MLKKNIRFCMVLFLLFPCFYALCQVKIVGPACVLSNVEYQYQIYSDFDKNQSISICVNGGYISTINNTCYAGKYIDSVRVIWNDNVSNGSITVSTSSSNNTFSVRQTQSLQGGSIDSSIALQQIGNSDIPRTILCSAAIGGGCSPSYNYQWEQSYDNLHWHDFANSASQNLLFSEFLAGTTFFRRKCLESTSNSIAYSNVAIVVVANP
jgi:hypothetical protein